jgi:hypothetical protein
MNLLSSEDKLAHSLPHSSKIQIDNWKEIKDTTVLHTRDTVKFLSESVSNCCLKASEHLWERPSYDSLIYNYLCNQCLSPLTLWARIPLTGKCTHCVTKFVSDMRKSAVLFRVELRFLPTIKLIATIYLKYCWKWR